ncbi:MBL fold metallo-hydrolase RNA specificity domain-containing protein [Methylobacter sp. BBA5.1]|uniref:MBL fold metallo-hydrolase RNA specificity domain-containing protein n=1 Tax=Methylobacter sp. BBA5.1 TaxID=1495064 RepID=UPI00056D7708|nr:MBL fold metallo-hydrolase [Methylobacter sp. BBA5.1]
MNRLSYPDILHHGGVSGVTGSCHELRIDQTNSVLIDCGLFQGLDASPGGSGFNRLAIDFPIASVQALLVTHCHVDHVGRIPYLMAAGFKGPIYCTEPTAQLLPLVLEDAVAIGLALDKALVRRFMALLTSRIVTVPYASWQTVPLSGKGDARLSVKFRQAGHILGSAYIECKVAAASATQRIVFSGDLGSPYTPLLPAPKSPYQADVLVLESTYGDRKHVNRRQRKSQLKQLVKRCLKNRGVILIPAFSIGRTQELLYEFEEIIHQSRTEPVADGLVWDELEIIVDSPLANRFTQDYKKLKPYWDAEARARIQAGRRPLSFEQLTLVNSHWDHLNALGYLTRTAKPCVVLAASGMCSGGRIVNYLKALIEDPRTDILFVGYQAEGTPGSVIQQNGAAHGQVELDGRLYVIHAGVYTLDGYSGHADQDSLVRFVTRMRKKPREIRLVHGERETKQTLQRLLQQKIPDCQVLIP